jgi:hypothetical protein
VEEREPVAEPDAGQAADLEYDLAHERAAAAEAPSGQQRRPSVYVPTETKDYDGDYGYDLAHDVPGR